MQGMTFLIAWKWTFWSILQ